MLESFAGRSIVNLILRSLILVSKFLLIFFLAKFLTPAEMGEYGLIVVTISYLLYFLGMDFYTYSTREVLSVNKVLWGAMLRDQAVLYLITYVLVIPVVILIFASGLLAWKYLIVFYVLLILEHFNQEVFRFLNAISKPVIASMLLFFRASIWCYIVIFLFFLYQPVQSVSTVLWGWIFGNIIALLLGLYQLKAVNWDSCRGKSVNWKWIGRGLKVASGLLIGTLALRGIMTFDRYMLSFYENKSIVGVYSFYMSVTNVIITFLDASVFVFFYPKLIELYAKSDAIRYKVKIKRMFQYVFGISFLLSLIAAIFIFPVTEILDKAIYAQYLNAYFILILSVFIMAVGMVPHFGLYAMKQDKSVFLPHIISLPVFMLTAFILIPRTGITGAATSILVTYIFTGVYKFICYKKHSRRFFSSGV